MKNKKIIRLFTAALAVALCATALLSPAFAGGGEPGRRRQWDAEAPEVTITDEEDPAGDDSADNIRRPTGDTLDQMPSCWAAWGL